MFHLQRILRGECSHGLLNAVLLILLDFRRLSVLTESTVEFGVIPRDHWYQPDWIDEQKAASARSGMVASNVKYGGTWDLSSFSMVNEY